MKKNKPPRQIEIVWDPALEKQESGGIYRIWFGEKFYIGRTRYLKSRAKSHQQDINRRLCGKTVVGEMDFLQHVIRHLKAHKRTVVCRIEVLAYTDDDNELVALEQKHFDECKTDKNCLNYGFVANPYKCPRVIPKAKEKRSPSPNRKQASGKLKARPVAKKKKYVFESIRQKLKRLKAVLAKLDRQHKSDSRKKRLK